MKFSVDQLENFLWFLQQIKKEVSDSSVCGLCKYFQYKVDYYLPHLDYHKDYRDYLRNKWENWDKFSGNRTFPVPCEGVSPSAAYTAVQYKWDSSSQYGRDRRELLDFLIEEVKKDIKRES